MKKTGAIFLFICMLLSALPGYGHGAPVEISDEIIKQMAEQYLNMDIDAMIRMAREAGRGMDEATIENMRNMQKMARDGTLGDFMRGLGAPGGNSAAPPSEPPLPSEGTILDIAKKYYDYHSNALQSSLKGDFTSDVGTVGFDGSLNDAERADKLCNTASIIAMFEGDGDYAVACAAAAIGWSQGYARSAGTLAAVLEMAGFVTDRARLADAAKLAEYAISIDKSDAGFYITLGRVRFVQGDLDPALEAAEAALALEPGNRAALYLKIEILNKKGGAFLSAAASKIGNDLKENDGELSKRLTEQERATEGMTGANDGDSKEEILRKLNEFYTLKPITPADMIEPVFPSEAQQIRRQINTVSAEDIALFTNNIRPFPNGLYRTAQQVYEMRDEIEAYWKWDNEYLASMYVNVMLPAELAADAARIQRGTSSPDEITPLDYMWDYNFRVLWNAQHAVLTYLLKLSEEHQIERIEIAEKRSRKHAEAREIYEAELKAAEPLSEPARSAAIQAATVKFHVKCNEATDIYFKESMPLYSKYYDEAKRLSQQLWENMLPFARATRHPEYRVLGLYNDAHNYIELTINALGNFGTSYYYLEVAAGDLQAIEEALRAIQELMAQEHSLFYDVTNGLTISIALGPIELKFSNTNVEVEAVKIAAVRVSYDWKNKEVEVGVGVGVKAKLAAGTGVGVEAKSYANFVIDVRKVEVTDVYVSAEAKGSFFAHEGGVEGRVSVMGKGASLSTSSKQGLGVFAIEHKREIISTN